MKPPRFTFTKMHGLGNDFIVVDGRHFADFFTPSLVASLADRHTGIGFDQLLIIQTSQQADFYCRIFNADGSEAEQCGNGLRCVARYLHENGLAPASHFKLATQAGVYPIEIQNYDQICVTMGAPQIQAPLTAFALPETKDHLSLSILSVGNPHAIVKVDSFDALPLLALAEKIASSTHFPEGVNVGFMHVIDPGHVRLRTIERGAGETFACGSNACAAAVAGMVNGWLNHAVEVEFQYGSLLITWDESQGMITMTGPAAAVFRGEVGRVD